MNTPAAPVSILGVCSLLLPWTPVIPPPYVPDAVTALAAVGDVDGDGVTDLAVGASGNDRGVGRGPGRCTVHSGKDGRELFTVRGASDGDRFGEAVVGVGDVDGDGKGDVAVGARAARGSGTVAVYSGSSGKCIWERIGDSPGSAFGRALAATGDLNGDKVPDIVVGAPLASVGDRNRCGSIHALSGKDGRPLFSATGNRESRNLGSILSAVGDINKDGIPDIAESSGTPIPGDLSPGATDLEVRSGKDGSVLFGVPSKDDYAQVGGAVRLGDWNSDGNTDLAVVSPSATGKAGLGCGAIRVISGVDGKVLARWEGRREWDNCGMAVAFAGDANGDGVADLWVSVMGGEYMEKAKQKATARTELRSGKDGAVLRAIPNRKFGEQVGTFLAESGDWNKDGSWDIAAAGPGSSDVFIYSGKDGSLLLTIRPPSVK
jgi:hypothetical protein